MAQQPYLYAFYNDPRVAFSPKDLAAGNAALSQMFGSPDASRAIAAQAQNLSGVTSAILKKLLPVIVGMIISGLMRSGSGRAAPQAPQQLRHPAPDQGGGLIDILRQIFQQGGAEGAGRPRAGSGSTPGASLPSATFSASLRKTWPTRRNQSRRPQGRASVRSHSNRLGRWHGAGRRCARPDSARAGEGHSRRTRQTGHRRSVRDRHPRDIEARRSRPDADSWRRYPRPDPARNARRQRRKTAIARPNIRCGFGGVRRSDRDRHGTSTRARSTACKRCSTASLARQRR